MELEDLRNYFQPITEEVRDLPTKKEAYDKQFFIKVVDGTPKIYVMFNGKLYFVTNLTEA